MKKVFKLLFVLCTFLCLPAYPAIPELTMPALTEDSPFAFVPVGLSQKQLNALDKLTVNTEFNVKEYRHFGDMSVFEEDIPRFLQTIGDNDKEHVEAAATVLLDIIKAVIKSSNYTNALVIFRTALPMKEFEVPNWHLDWISGNYGEPLFPPSFLMTLKGPHTLFYPATAEEKAAVKLHMPTSYMLSTREYLSQQLDAAKIVSPNAGEGVFFLGQNAVHSQPDIKQERFFLYVLPYVYHWGF
jgi:hypothetical protein